MCEFYSFGSSPIYFYLVTKQAMSTGLIVGHQFKIYSSEGEPIVRTCEKDDRHITFENNGEDIPFKVQMKFLFAELIYETKTSQQA